jgi:hypothetical protein
MKSQSFSDLKYIVDWRAMCHNSSYSDFKSNTYFRQLQMIIIIGKMMYKIIVLFPTKVMLELCLVLDDDNL